MKKVLRISLVLTVCLVLAIFLCDVVEKEGYKKGFIAGEKNGKLKTETAILNEKEFLNGVTFDHKKRLSGNENDVFYVACNDESTLVEFSMRKIKVSPKIDFTKVVRTIDRPEPANPAYIYSSAEYEMNHEKIEKKIAKDDEWRRREWKYIREKCLSSLSKDKYFVIKFNGENTAHPFIFVKEYLEGTVDRF